MSDQTYESANDFSLTLARGLQVLELFSPTLQAVTTSDTARRLGISRAAARRFLLTLAKLGYLNQTNANFSLTEKIATIGQGQLARQDRWSRVAPDVLQLANRLDESVSISVLDGLAIRFVVRDPKRRMFSSHLVVGDTLPAHCSAAGKILLAALEPEHLSNLLSTGPLSPRTPRTITDPADLARELRLVRIRSWAVAEDEMELGTISVAVPIFDSDNGVIAALAMASHRMRRTIDELRYEFLPVLADAAERIGARIRGDQGP